MAAGFVPYYCVCFIAVSHVVSVSLSLDADYNSVVGDDSESVTLELRQQIADMLNVSIDQIQNIKISPGLCKF